MSRIVLIGYDPRPRATLASPFDTYQGDRLAYVAGLNGDRTALQEAFECWNAVDPRTSREAHRGAARELAALHRESEVVIVGKTTAELLGVEPNPQLTWRRGAGFARTAVVTSPSRLNREWDRVARDVGRFLSASFLEHSARLRAASITNTTDVTDVTDATDLIGYAEAAKMLGVEVEHLRVLVHRRQIPHVRLAKRTVRFSKLALRLWIERRTVDVGEPGPV